SVRVEAPEGPGQLEDNERERDLMTSVVVVGLLAEADLERGTSAVPSVRPEGYASVTPTEEVNDEGDETYANV
ncbi:hypothetical protein HDU93_006599, partial [Gonapodya sp. JEL0774]